MVTELSLELNPMHGDLREFNELNLSWIRSIVIQIEKNCGIVWMETLI